MISDGDVERIEKEREKSIFLAWDSKKSFSHPVLNMYKYSPTIPNFKCQRSKKRKQNRESHSHRQNDHFFCTEEKIF